MTNSGTFNFTVCRLIAQAVSAGSLHEAARHLPESASRLRAAADVHRANVAVLAELDVAEAE